MAIRHGIVASAVALPPTVSLSAASNFNQELATLNATVDANGYSTTVKFQYSTASNFSSFTEVNAATTPITGQSVSSYANITGLSVNTTYYFRCVASNSAGTTTSSSLSFTTWNIQVYERSTSGGTTFTIPTVTPTGGSAVTVSILDIILFAGGGGGGILVGGGGGGYQNISSRTMTGSRSVTTSVGGGGAAVNTSTGTNPTVGGTSTISGDLTTVTASGGGADTAGNSVAGASGNGNAGGSTVSYDYTPGDSKGYTNTAYGGGGGAGGVGGNGVANSSGTYGGNGGVGVSITSGGVTRAGGAGGGSGYFAPDGGPGGNGVQGSNNTYGSGGNPSTAGQAGYIRFRYYAASALA